MNLCSNCINDKYLSTIVESRKNLDVCDICSKYNMNVYNTDEDDYLVAEFENLFDEYKKKDDLPTNYANEYLNNITKELRERWKIFSFEESKVLEVIIEICKERYYSDKLFFSTLVGIEKFGEKNYIEDNSILKNCSWKSFTESLKTNNRFHSTHINYSALEKVLENKKQIINKNKVLYRARISEDGNSIIKEKMGVPPEGKASEGRANAKGIGCLYLCEDDKTTVKEIRAGLFDYVCIGAFKAKEELTIIDLSELDSISPFWGEDINVGVALNIRFLTQIADDIAKPLSRYDSDLEYLPTQYISDFIKSKGYDGIKYKSTIDEGGVNYAIFNYEKFGCIRVENKSVKCLNYEFA